MHVDLEPVDLDYEEEFWCSRCDNNKVNSTNKETGRFFNVWGHSHSKESKKFDGEYLGVMFSVCRACLLVQQAFDN